jgi:hypothetical protein
MLFLFHFFTRRRFLPFLSHFDDLLCSV